MQPDVLNPPQSQTSSTDNASNLDHIKKTNKFSKHIIILITLLISFLLILVLIFIYRQTYVNQSRKITNSGDITPALVKSKNPKWNNYVNKSIGYSIDYPETYEVEEIPEPNYTVFKSPLKDKFQISEIRDRELILSILTYNNAGSTLDDIMLNAIKSSFYADGTSKEGKEYQVKMVKINGMDAVYRTGAHDPPNSEEYIFLHNGFIVLMTKYPKITPLQDDFDKMLSTFKFIP